jgi:hypothetical protein
MIKPMGRERWRGSSCFWRGLLNAGFWILIDNPFSECEDREVMSGQLFAISQKEMIAIFDRR